jgi:hypothetical protein
MVDMLDNELECGDIVAYTEPRYSELKLGYVMYVTPKGARIISGHANYEINRLSDQMILIKKVL